MAVIFPAVFVMPAVPVATFTPIFHADDAARYRWRESGVMRERRQLEGVPL